MQITQTTPKKSKSDTSHFSKYQSTAHLLSSRSTVESHAYKTYYPLLPTKKEQFQNKSPFENISNRDSQQDYILQRNDFTIQRVVSLKQRIKTNTFIKHMYSSRGYLTEDATAFSYNPNQITFVACIGEIVVGTVTLGVDSEEGLLADGLYQQEINNFRTKNRKVCELSKFALDPQYSSKEMIASLFQVAYIHAHDIHKVTDLFCEVNPRHAAPQKRMFGFRQIGKMRICPRVDAPAVLLHLKMNYIDTMTASLTNGNTCEFKHRSLLYVYFLTQHAQEKLTNKIQHQHQLIEQQLNNNPAQARPSLSAPPTTLRLIKNYGS